MVRIQQCSGYDRSSSQLCLSYGLDKNCQVDFGSRGKEPQHVDVAAEVPALTLLAIHVQSELPIEHLT
jgi:hypothetical protein